MVGPVRVAAAYLLLGTFSFAVAVAWRGSSPFSYPDPWLSLDRTASHGLSTLLGICFGALLVAMTRFSVPRFRWAQALHTSLRPFARGMSTPAIVSIAALSAMGEELLFRGLLQPGVGLVIQALLFGAAHQLPGPSRWVWVSWATLTGLALGGLFQLTGSLLGPICAHALVNGINLSYLRAHDPERRRSLGGLLGGGSSHPGPRAARLR